MKRGQKVIVIVSACLIVAAILYPPWNRYFGEYERKNEGHYFLLSPPKDYKLSVSDYMTLTREQAATLREKAGITSPEGDVNSQDPIRRIVRLEGYATIDYNRLILTICTIVLLGGTAFVVAIPPRQ